MPGLGMGQIPKVVLHKYDPIPKVPSLKTDKGVRD